MDWLVKEKQVLNKMKQYSKYKDAETDWQDKIPESWQMKRCKFLFKIRKRIAGKEGHQVLSITQQGIKVKDIESGEGQLSMDYSKYQFANAGDFAMNHMDLLTGYVDISKYDGVVSPDYRVFTIEDEKASAKYYLYLFQKGYTDKIFYACGRGSSHLGRWRFPREEFVDFRFPYPSPKEQQAIANFLDYKTVQIDKLVSVKEKQIELLKEEWTTVINQAVTKGLDPNVKMKDSGIDWLEKIPEHWGTTKIKYSDDVLMGQSPSSDDYNDEQVGLPFLQGNADFTELYPKPRIWCETANKETQENDILLSVRAPVGAVNISDRKYGIGRGLCAIRSKETFFKLLYYFSIALNEELNSIGTGSTYTAISVDDVNNTSIPRIEPSEQQAIADYLDKQTARIGTSIQKAKKQIELLKEYRTVLISEAVTGKIDVRGNNNA